MGFTIPAALALLGLSIPILLLYLLRLRREDRVVSSVYLWQHVVRDLEANAPWQRLRSNLLLFLQLAALAALVLALAGPYFPSSRLQGSDLILILDTSASMGATDLRPSRLGSARQEVLRLAASLPPQGRVTLIAASGVPQVLLAHSTDRGLLRATLDSLQPTAASSDLTPALHLAATLAAESPQAEVVLLSDGQVTMDDAVSLPAPFRFIPLGESDLNQGIVACSLGPAGPQLGLFVRVRNYAAVPARRRLDLYADGALLSARHLDLPPRSDLALTFEVNPSVEVVEARLFEQDDLQIDDAAWAVHAEGSRGQVVMVSAGNRFLQTGLGLLPGMDLELVSPEAFPDWWQTRQEEGNLPAMFIFDAWLPAELPPSSLFIVAPPTSTALFRVEGPLEAPRLRPARDDDPLLQYVDVSAVGVRRAQAVALPSWARAVLADAAGWPLLFIGETGGRQVAVLSFDLHDSDLPLQIAFPLLLANLYDTLVPAGVGVLPQSLAPGEPLVIEVPPQVEEIVVYGPDGREVNLFPREGRAVYEGTAAVGIYEVAWRGQDRELGRGHTAVALLSAAEGDIAPLGELPQPVFAEEGAAEGGQSGRLSLSRGLAAVALVLLLAEWAVAHRGGLVGLFDAWRRLWSRVRRETGA